jgi:hypothetical protein
MAAGFLCTLSVVTQWTRGAVIVDDAADAALDANNTVESTNNTQNRVGESTSNGFGRAAIYPFQLPSLGAVTNPFTSASLSVVVGSISSNLPAGTVIDLDGLPSRATPTALGADYSATPSTAGNAIQAGSDAFLPTTVSTGTKTTSSSGSANLLGYLNEHYASGAGAGQYVFLRVEPSSVSNGAAGYNIDANESGPSFAPTITYTALPEPATLGLLSLCGAGLLGRRRRAAGGSK